MADQQGPQVRIERLVRLLCSPACAGRLPSSAEGIAARNLIVEEFAGVGLVPLGNDGFVQPVPRCGANVLGMIPGSGPKSDRAVLVAAHYDHLGHGDDGAVYWGADDNAAAVAIMVEVTRQLQERRDQLDRSVIFAAFDGEEQPHFMQETMGSMYYVEHPPHPIDRLDLMVCMDLVGHALGPEGLPAAIRNSLFVMGSELSEGTAAMVDAVSREHTDVTARPMGLDVVPPLSDYHAFREAAVPVLFLTCGRWEHYHQPTDTPDRLDYPKMTATAHWLRDLTLAAANRPEPEVAFHPDGRDDATTLRTLIEMGRALAPHQPTVSSLLPMVEALAAKADAGPLSSAEARSVSQLVAGLESLLQ